MKRNRLASLLVAAVLAVGSLAGCSSGMSGSDGAADSSSAGGVAAGEPGLEAIDMAPGLATGRATEAVSEAVSAKDAAAAPHVVTTAEVQLTAQHPEQAAEAVNAVVADLKGSVESLTVQRSSGDAPAGAQLSVRVPPERVDEAIEQFAEIGEIVSQSRSAQDVTTEYVDLEARIKALETSVKRLNDLMAGAATTTELIEAEGALTQRQQELDGLRAQFKALDNQVSQATIWVSITAPSVLPGGGPGSFWEGLVAGLDSLVAAGTGALVLLGVLLPWLVVAAVLATAGVITVRSRRARRARASRPDAQTPAQP